jgi:hypothetical protein
MGKRSSPSSGHSSSSFSFLFELTRKVLCGRGDGREEHNAFDPIVLDSNSDDPGESDDSGEKRPSAILWHSLRYSIDLCTHQNMLKQLKKEACYPKHKKCSQVTQGHR